MSTDNASIISKLDLVVGKIKTVKRHPEADKLFIEEIDVGEETERTILTGLAFHKTLEEMKDRIVVVIRNLKPRALKGIKSHGMILCATTQDQNKIDFLIPPESSLPGDKVYFKGHEGTPDSRLNPKKKIFETCQQDFNIREDCIARWKDIPFQTDKGMITVDPLYINGSIS